MKVIIAGSRSIANLDKVVAAVVNSQFIIKEVVSGGARGVDKLGEQWARDNSVPVKMFRAKWSQFGKVAGHIRNSEMAKYADALIAVWDGRSKGTKNMISTMRVLGKPIHCEIFRIAKAEKC